MQKRIHTAEEIMITTECEEFINNHINRRTTSDEPKPDVIVVHDNDSSDSGSDNCWMMIKSFSTTLIRMFSKAKLCG